MTPRVRLKHLPIVIFLWLVTQLAQAQTTYSGAAGGNWHDVANWTNGIPAPGNNAIIPGGAGVTVQNALLIEYLIENYGTIEVAQNVTVSAIGNVQNSGTILLANTVWTNENTTNNYNIFTLDANSSVINTANFFSNGTLTNNGSLTNTGNFSNLGTLSNTGSIANSGQFNNNTTLTNTGSISNTDGFFTNQFGAVLSGAGSIAHTGGIFANGGTLQSNGVFTSSAPLNNANIIALGGIITLSNTINNSGTFTVTSTGMLTNTALFNNYNSVIVQGTFHNSGDFQNSLTLQVAANGTFTNAADGRLLSYAGTTLSNDGTFINLNTATLAGTVTNTGAFGNSQTLVMPNGSTLTNTGTFVQTQGSFDMNGVANFNGGTVTFQQGTWTIGSAAITNNAALLTLQAGTVTTNNGSFTTEGDMTVAGSYTNAQFFTNTQTLHISGAFINQYVLQNEGTLTLSGSFQNTEGAVVSNQNTFINQGTFTNQTCATFVNNLTLQNDGNFINDGIYQNNGTQSGNPIQHTHPDAETEAGIQCKATHTAYIGIDGEVNIIAQDLLLGNFCEGLTFTLNNEQYVTLACNEVGVTTTINVAATDFLGNTFTCQTTVSVTDTLAPTLLNCPNSFSVPATTAAGAVVSWAAPAITDNCCLSSVSEPTLPSGSMFPIGTHTISYIATDCSGNRSTCTFVVTVGEKICTAERVTHGLVALYDFKNSSGNTIADKSNYLTPLNLTIANTQYVSSAGGCGLTLTGNAGIVSATAANKITTAIRNSNAVTLEAWLQPAALNQLSHIISLSNIDEKTNLLLGQENNNWTQRMRTATTGLGGYPQRQTAASSALQHYVYTRDAAGVEKITLNGVTVHTGIRTGDLLNWNETYRLAIGNAVNGTQAWAGSLYLTAIYNRALSSEEIMQNYTANVCCSAVVTEESVSIDPTDCPAPIGQVRRELWSAIPGDDLGRLTGHSNYPDNPSSVSYLNDLSSAPTVATNFGERVSGYLRVDTDGLYVFTVTGDADVQLYLSTTASPDDSQLIASIDGATQPEEFDAYPTQQSSAIYLFAGKDYFLQVLHKQGNTGGFYKIFWQTPANPNRTLLPAAHIAALPLCPEDLTYGNPCPAFWGGLTREYWNHISGGNIADLTTDPRYPNQPTGTSIISTSQGPTNIGNNYGTRVRGRIRVPQAGAYTFLLTADNTAELYLSSNYEPQHKVRIAYIDTPIEADAFDTLAYQRAVPVTLLPGREYYMELLHAEAQYDDHFAIYWRKPNSDVFTLIPSECLAPYEECASQEEEPCGTTALLVVGNTTLNASDAAIKTHLEQIGFNVVVKKDALVQTSDARQKGLIVISSSVIAGYVNTKFTNVPVPVVTWEAWLFDDLQMTGEVLGLDYGTGGMLTTTQMTLPQHPIANGQSGTVTVFGSAQNYNYGKPAVSADYVAQVPTNEQRSMVFAYAKNEPMIDMDAPHRRVGLFLNDQSVAHLTANGWKLVENAFIWASGCSHINFRQMEIEKNNNILLFPNPCYENIFIDLQPHVGKLVQIAVSDAWGRLLHIEQHDALGQTMVTLNTQNYTSGTYFVKLIIDEVVQTHKITVIKE